MPNPIPQAEQQYPTGAAAPEAPPVAHNSKLNFVIDQLAGSMANAAFETSRYGKTNDVSAMVDVIQKNPDLPVGLHVPPDKVTSVAGQPDFTRLEMQVGTHKEIIAMPNKQLEQLGALPNVMAAQELQPQPARQPSAAETNHPLANHPDVIAAIQQTREALNNSQASTANSGTQAPARGTGFGGR